MYDWNYRGFKTLKSHGGQRSGCRTFKIYLHSVRVKYINEKSILEYTPKGNIKRCTSKLYVKSSSQKRYKTHVSTVNMTRFVYKPKHDVITNIGILFFFITTFSHVIVVYLHVDLGRGFRNEVQRRLGWFVIWRFHYHPFGFGLICRNSVYACIYNINNHQNIQNNNTNYSDVKIKNKIYIF